MLQSDYTGDHTYANDPNETMPDVERSSKLSGYTLYNGNIHY